MKLPGPDHPIAIAPARGRVTVRFRGEVVAHSDAALELREATYPAVLYIPRGDIRPDHLRRTDSRTHCPYKGDASYFTLVGAGAESPDAAWSYEDPYPAMAAIREYVAFYPDRVTIERQ